MDRYFQQLPMLGLVLLLAGCSGSGADDYRTAEEIVKPETRETLKNGRSWQLVDVIGAEGPYVRNGRESQGNPGHEVVFKVKGEDGEMITERYISVSHDMSYLGIGVTNQDDENAILVLASLPDPDENPAARDRADPATN